LSTSGIGRCGGGGAVSRPLFQITEVVTRGSGETASAWSPPQDWPITAIFSVASLPA
jgi:hypothetical protein